MNKPVILTILCLIFAHVALAAGSTVTADSKITAVTVYPSRAMVTRTAILQLQPGEYEVVFENLPPEMVDGSVLVSGHGSSLKLGTVETKRVYRTETVNAELKKLEETLEGLRDKEALINAAIMAAAQKRELLTGISLHSKEVWSKELTVGMPSVEEWQKVVDYLHDGQLDAAKEELGLRGDLKDVQKEIAAVQQQMNEVRYKGQGMTYSATVELKSGSAGKVDMELKYLVTGAYWSPYYEARVDAKEGGLELVYNAKVSQGTSEDWDGVSLMFSTARPAIGATPPAITPWNIGIYYPEMYRAKVGFAPGQMSAQSADFAQSMEIAGIPEEDAAETLMGEVDFEGAFAVFTAATSQDIPADGSVHTVRLAAKSFEPLFRYITIPKLGQHAYMKGFFTNTKDYPLLDGQVAVYHGDDFVGMSRVEGAAPGEKVEMALGVDDSVKVKREQVKKYEEDGGVLSDNRRVNYEYRITVENFKDEQQTISVVEQVPVSSMEEVKVKETIMEPKPVSRKEDGTVKWEFVLEPGQKAEAHVGYYIEYPAGAALTGM